MCYIIWYYSAVGEQSLISIRASVVIYDDTYKKWLPCGQLPSGISKIHIYHNTADKTYRIVGRKIQDKEVRFWNCSISSTELVVIGCSSLGVSRSPTSKLKTLNYCTQSPPTRCCL